MVVSDPNGTSSSDVQGLRAAGFTDAQVFAVTVFRVTADGVLDGQRRAPRTT